MWEGAAGWSTQLRRSCWVATGLSRWMGCSDPQGPGRGRESINPAKMKLCPGCHNPFASSKLYKLFAVFFAFGWWLVWIQSVEVLLSSFLNRQKWYVGILGKCCSCKTKENQQQHRSTASRTCPANASSRNPCGLTRSAQDSILQSGWFKLHRRNQIGILMEIMWTSQRSVRVSVLLM